MPHSRRRRISSRKQLTKTDSTEQKNFGVLRQNHLLLWKTQEDAERGLPELKSFFIDTYSELSSANHTCNSESTAGDAAQGEGDPTKEDSEGANGQWANGKRYELQLGMSTHQHSTSVQYDKRWLAFDSEDERHSFIEAVETAAKQLGQQPPPPKLESKMSSYGFGKESGFGFSAPKSKLTPRTEQASKSAYGFAL